MEMTPRETIIFNHKTQNYVDDYQLSSNKGSGHKLPIQGLQKMDEQIKALQELARQNGEFYSSGSPPAGAQNAPPNSKAGVDSTGFSFQRENY